ncbi:MAG: O-antigen ligase family protein [Candidatus Ventricola sp.]
MKKWLPELVSMACAVFMLCVFPLLFRNAFFDINRFKVETVCRVVPVLALLMAALVLPKRRKEACVPHPGRTSRLLMLLFLASCVVACARTGFESATLDGSEGRYCGLIFMLCCGAAFFIISEGKSCGRLIVPIVLCAAAAALLGLLNAMGVDPLGFYVRIKEEQKTVFMSTIGHFDFFGTYLVILFPLAAGQFVFAGKKGMRAFGMSCAVVMALGAMASRTDSALIGLHLACFALLAVSGGSLSEIARALALWAMVCAALPVTCVLLRYSAFSPQISGLPGLLFDLHAGELLCVLLLALSAVCFRLARRGWKAPGRKKTAAVLFAGLALAALVLLGVMVYFSSVDTKTDLGEAAAFLRFNDSWGSLRGFVWIRSLRAFADAGFAQKVFGAGMELTLRVLTPYFDDPSMLRYGVFNDPHCQMLQMLLTCGLLGMTAFVLFYVSMLVTLLRHVGRDPLVCSVFASVFAYSIVMLINVTQPILIGTYFSVCALGLSVLRMQRFDSGGNTDEP